MKRLVIKKFIGNNLDEETTVPVMFISLLHGLLPSSALEGLTQNGFNFDQILACARNNAHYRAETTVEENGIKKRIELFIKE
ncbi:hypothetical protein [Klebsiella sp. BIGb0407]|uniref:hypothetical protein n=1 Tax=Klebsiella sp. BIGb0407 TaxID=2940603 RepID=UPI0021687380|nr:hypothetical protein [Klebsiella sp. BIGb0407]MCS3430079.1 hypothetical protein [Klebsiella sp. BIGb0407]